MSVSNQPTNADSTTFITGGHSDVSHFTSVKGIKAELETMRRLTHEIFGESYQITMEEDAEIEGDLQIVFEVKSRGDISSVLVKEDRWHEGCVTLAPKAAPFVRLFVDII